MQHSLLQSKTAAEQQSKLESAMRLIREAYAELTGVGQGRPVLEGQVQEARDFLSRASQRINNVKGSLAGV